MKKVWLGALVAGAIACGDGGNNNNNNEPQAEVTTSDAINGLTPEGAVFAFFGQDLEAESFDLEIFLSSRETACDDIAAGLFDDPLLPPDGEHVQLLFTGPGALPLAGTTLVNDAETGLDFVSVGFSASAAGVLTVAAFNPFFGPDGTSLTVDVFENEATLEGSFASVLVSEESDPANIQEINVEISGSFRASHCQAISDQLAL